MRSRAAPQQRLICNRGLIKHPRLGSGAHVRDPEAATDWQSKICPQTKTGQARIAQAVQTAACLATTAVTSPRSTCCDTRFAVLSCAHATSFLFHSALSPEAPLVNSPTPCLLHACPFRTEHSTHQTAPKRPKITQQPATDVKIRSRSTLQPTTRPRSEKTSHVLTVLYARIQEKEPHDASSSLADQPGLGS